MDHDAVQLSVVIPHDTYRQLHELRVARCNRGARIPALGQLVREALADYLERGGKMYVDTMLSTTVKAVP